MKKFVYVGDGAGVPGLPHEITDEQAKEQGVIDLLNDAVKNGAYAEVVEKKKEVKHG